MLMIAFGGLGRGVIAFEMPNAPTSKGPKLSPMGALVPIRRFRAGYLRVIDDLSQTEG